MIPVIFSITPKSGTISYYRPHPDTNLLEIPAGDVVKRLARTHEDQLGIDLGQVASARLAPHFNKDENYNDITSQICGRSVFLPRLLDGICFADTSDDGGNGGFWIEFGSHGQIEGFSIVWPSLERYEQSQTASPQQIVACIRAFKTMTPPIGQETNYFARIKSFAKAKALIITKIIPYYGEWVYGEMPTEDVPSPIIAPFAELQAVADFGNSNTPVRLFSPILSSQATQILIDKTK